MELNVDIVCEYTAEVISEGIHYDSAIGYIREREGVIADDVVETIDLDDIDGGGQMQIRSIWVEFPDRLAELRETRWAQTRAAKFWLYDEKSCNS